MFDTHTHIYLEDFKEDRNKIISECIENDVNKLLLPNIDSTTINDVIKLSLDNKNICYPMVGLHPCSVKNTFEKELAILKPYVKNYSPVAIGETGIDLFWDKTRLKFNKKHLKSKLVGLKNLIYQL